MRTINGREIRIEDIVLYNVVEQGKAKRIAVLVREDLNSEPKPEIVPYSEVNESTILAGMKQTEKVSKSKAGNVKVTYTDKSTLIYPTTREELILSILGKQRELKKEKVLSDNWDSIDEEEKVEEINRKNKKLKGWLTSSLVFAALALGAGHFIATNKNDKIDDNNNKYADDPAKVYEMSDKELAELDDKSEIVTRTDRTYAFDINNPAVIKSKGIELYSEINAKNMYLLTTGEIVKFDETLAIEVVSLLNGLYPETMKQMDATSARAELEKAQQAIMLIHASNLNTETKSFVKLSDYVADSKEQVLFSNAFVIARYAVDESIGNPMNGKIIESEDEINKFTRGYTNAVDQLLHYEIDTKNDPIYNEAGAGFRWTVATLFEAANATIPQWSYVIRTSQPDQRENEYPYRYFLNDSTNELWRAVPGANGTTAYESVSADGQKRTMTEPEMYEYDENDINLRQLGIETEVREKREKAQKDIDILIKTNSMSGYSK